MATLGSPQVVRRGRSCTTARALAPSHPAQLPTDPPRACSSLRTGNTKTVELHKWIQHHVESGSSVIRYALAAPGHCPYLAQPAPRRRRPQASPLPVPFQRLLLLALWRNGKGAFTVDQAVLSRAAVAVREGRPHLCAHRPPLGCVDAPHLLVQARLRRDVVMLPCLLCCHSRPDAASTTIPCPLSQASRSATPKTRSCCSCACTRSAAPTSLVGAMPVCQSAAFCSSPLPLLTRHAPCPHRSGVLRHALRVARAKRPTRRAARA